MDKIDPLRPRIPRPKARHGEPLAIYQIGIIMIIFMAGIALSLVIFLLELLNSIGRQVVKPRETGPRWAERRALRENTKLNTVAEESHSGQNRQDMGEGEDGNKTGGHGIYGEVVFVEIH